MVMKNRESKLKTSAIVVSSLLLYVVSSFLTSFNLVTVGFQPGVKVNGSVSPMNPKRARD